MTHSGVPPRPPFPAPLWVGVQFDKVLKCRFQRQGYANRCSSARTSSSLNHRFNFEEVADVLGGDPEGFGYLRVAPAPGGHLVGFGPPIRGPGLVFLTTYRPGIPATLLLPLAVAPPLLVFVY